jgi:hypothetical protein
MQKFLVNKNSLGSERRFMFSQATRIDPLDENIAAAVKIGKNKMRELTG